MILEKVNDNNFYVLENMMQLYLYDVNNDFKINFKDGLFEYDFEESVSYFIKVDNELVGFVIVLEGETFEISEFFIMRSFRKAGLGFDVACKVFDMYKGSWVIKAIPNSLGAEKFWESTIKKYTNDNFQMEVVGKYNRKIWRFNNEKF